MTIEYNNYYSKNMQFNPTVNIINDEGCIENNYDFDKIIIAIYNGGKYSNRSLISVQSQKMKDIEIIIIDDNSNKKLYENR